MSRWYNEGKSTFQEGFKRPKGNSPHQSGRTPPPTSRKLKWTLCSSCDFLPNATPLNSTGEEGEEWWRPEDRESLQVEWSASGSSTAAAPLHQTQGPRFLGPSRIYHHRTRARREPSSALLHPRMTLTPKRTVPSSPPPGTWHPPRRRRSSRMAPLPGVPHSVLKTNSPSTAKTRLHSMTRLLRLENPFSMSSRRRPLTLG